MTPRRARTLLAASLALLAGVAVAWSTVDSDGSADLVGAAVTTSSTVPPPTPTVTTSTVVPSPIEAPAIRPARPGVPVRISIPSIGVEHAVVPVGFTPDGKMEVPGVDDAGWWAPGPRPGVTHGSSVIAAHVDYDGRPGVFRDLQRLEVGTDVIVTDDAGTIRRYRVRERFQVAKDQLPRAEVFRTGGPPVLTLITCGGFFDTGRRHYDDNIVVRAVPQ